MNKNKFEEKEFIESAEQAMSDAIESEVRSHKSQIKVANQKLGKISEIAIDPSKFMHKEHANSDNEDFIENMMEINAISGSGTQRGFPFQSSFSLRDRFDPESFYSPCRRSPESKGKILSS